MKKLILYWFKVEAARTARMSLALHFNANEIHNINHGYWERYLMLRPNVPLLPTVGGSVMLHLAAMSTGFYQELRARGKSDMEATKLFYDIAWKIYQKMGRFTWWISGWGYRNSYKRLLKATKLFRSFPFNSPSYQWEDVETNNNVVGFDCLKCPVAEYFEAKKLSSFCANTWCALDFPLAEIWSSKLKRTGSIAGGATKCDFRWMTDRGKSQ